MKRLALFGLLLLIFGCGENRIDCSSDEKFQRSVQSIMSSLNDEKKPIFEMSLQLIFFSQMENLKQDMMPLTAISKIKSQIDGKTADEVILIAKQIFEDQNARKREILAREIEDLKRQIAELNSKPKQNKELEKAIKIITATFSGRGIGQEQTVELKVKNEATFPIYKLYFKAKLSIENKQVHGTFNHSIPGGIKPLEERDFKIRTSVFYTHDLLNYKGTGPFTLSLYRIDGEDGNPILSYDPNDEKKVESLSFKLKMLNDDLDKIR